MASNLIKICTSFPVPDTVWRINLDAPEKGCTSSMDNADDRWWEQTDLVKLIMASNLIKICTSFPVPDTVWRINLDAPEKGCTASMDNADDR